MKNSKVTLFEWIPDITEDNLTVDWPAVQKEISEDALKWLLKQPNDKCQLMLERAENDVTRRLIAEFYDQTLATTYHLMWAK